ncbi:hypothetical protein BDY19DRAFT_965982 [Irpex rosettiformis]|uniref:Uncharacterized protein n=1 Tax=Irpex rosettiformis TaxID=378272 RepID=A0ACB8TTQ0_9APHY|nr:hypothetical protein BDY19DRAFT_965982 [Irpex rosettiformis]
MADSNADNEEHNSQSPAEPPQTSMTMHPLPYSGVPMHMYPFPPGLISPQPPRTKRRQVKNACTNCQKACKKCDDARPCLRCVKYGIAEECTDSQRKERQKGVKRGPYKKRDGKANNVEQQLDVSVQPAVSVPAAALAAGAAPPGIPYMHPLGYSPFFGQYPALTAGKPGEAPTYAFPQYYFAPIPMHPQVAGQEGEQVAYPPPNLIPATFVTPYAQQPYAGAPMPYMVPMPPAGPRSDGQPQIPVVGPPMPYAYPPPYAKPQSREGGSEIQQVQQVQQMVDPNRRDPRMDAYGRMPEGIASGHGKPA